SDSTLDAVQIRKATSDDLVMLASLSSGGQQESVLDVTTPQNVQGIAFGSFVGGTTKHYALLGDGQIQMGAVSSGDPPALNGVPADANYVNIHAMRIDGDPHWDLIAIEDT